MDTQIKPFTPPDPKGMKEFYEVYDEHYAEIRVKLMTQISSVPSFSALVKSMPAALMEEQSQTSRELMRGACVDGAWGPWLESQRAQGPRFEAMNISFGEWFDLISAFQQILVPHLVAKLGHKPPVLVTVLNAMNAYINVAMTAIGEEYAKVGNRPA